MNDLALFLSEFKVWVAGAAGAVLLALKLRKRISADNVDVAADAHRAGWIADMMSERDFLRRQVSQLQEERARDARTIGQLTAQVESMQRRGFASPADRQDA